MKTGKSVGQLLRFNVIVPLWLVVVLGASATLFAYFAWPGTREDIKFCAVVVAASTAIYSAYYVGAALRLRLQRDRKDKSFEILYTLNRPEFVTVRRFIEQNLKDHSNMSATNIYDNILAEEKLLHAITVVLGVYDDASIAIQCDYVDEDILYQSLGFLVPWTFKCLCPYIEQIRVNDKEAELYGEMEKLAIAWTSKKRLNGGSFF